MRNIDKKLDWFSQYDNQTRGAHALRMSELDSLLEEIRDCSSADKLYAAMTYSFNFGFSCGYQRAVKDLKKLNDV